MHCEVKALNVMCVTILNKEIEKFPKVLEM